MGDIYIASKPFLFTALLALSLIVLSLGACMAKDKTEDGLPDMSMLKSPSSSKMSAFLNETFPPGTDKAFIEKMLIDVAGAEFTGEVYDISENKDGTKILRAYRYKKTFWRSPLTDGKYRITVKYDNKDQVVDYISLSGPTSF